MRKLDTAKTDPMAPAPPTLGRVVHYLTRSAIDGQLPQLCPAIVTGTAPEGHEDPLEVHLEVFGLPEHDEERYVLRAKHGDGPGCWRWPPRV